MWYPNATAHAKAYGIPTEKVDLEHIVRAFSSMFSFNEKEYKAPFTIHCRKCDKAIQYQDNVDVLKRKFYCDDYGYDSPANSGVKSCKIEVTQYDLNRMTEAEVGKLFYTSPKDTGEDVWVLDTASNGNTLYTYTRRATEAEKIAFVRKAAKHARTKK